MKHKNDIAIAATSARSYNHRWRAKKLSWTDIGKIKYLFDGAVEYMDEVTLAYTREAKVITDAHQIYQRHLEEMMNSSESKTTNI